MRGSGGRSIACTAASILVLTLGAAPARAELAVEVEGCGEIDVAEIERLVALELAAVIAERDTGFPPARVRCEGDAMTIVVEDPVTRKRLERSLPIAMGKGRERTFALAISQLYLTSWLELVMEPPPEPVGPPRDAPGAAAARQSAQATVAPVVRAPTWTADASLGVTLRARGGSGLDTLGGSLRTVAYLPSGFGVFAQGSWESLRVVRARGHVDVSLASIGVGVAYRSSQRATLVLDGRLGASLTMLRLDGRANDESTIAGGGLGTAVDLGGAVGPTLLLGPFRLGVEAQCGWLVPRVTARVAGEAPVSLHGVWFGGALSVGLGFGGT